MPKIDPKNRRERREPRQHASTVREIMLAKLGPRGYGRLLEQLRKESA